MAPNSEVKFVLFSVGMLKNSESGVAKMYIPKLLEQHRGQGEYDISVVSDHILISHTINVWWKWYNPHDYRMVKSLLFEVMDYQLLH